MAPAPKRLGTRQLLADVYGCAEQGRNLTRDDFHDMYIRQLRFDSLFAQRIVIVDTHFLDGAFFTRISPATLVDLVGRGLHNRRLPIEVRTRPSGAVAGRRLAGALRSFLIRTEQATLNPFEFNAISNVSARQELSERLKSIPNTALQGRLERVDDGSLGEAMSSFLRELIGPSDADLELEQIGAGWTQWIEAERRGALPTRPWGPGRLDVLDAMSSDLPLDPNVLRTDLGRQLHTEVVETARQSTYRSDITKLVRDCRKGLNSTTHDLELSDLMLLDRWNFAARFIAEAKSQGTDVAYSFHAGELPLNDMERSLETFDAHTDSPDIVVDNDLVPGLGALTGPEYAIVTDSLRTQLESVWEHGSVGDVRRLIKGLEQAFAQSGASERIGPKGQAVGSVAVAAGVGVAGAFGGLTPVAMLVNAAVAGGAPVVAALASRWRTRSSRPDGARVLQYLRHRRRSR